MAKKLDEQTSDMGIVVDGVEHYYDSENKLKQIKRSPSKAYGDILDDLSERTGIPQHELINIGVVLLDTLVENALEDVLSLVTITSKDKKLYNIIKWVKSLF